MLIPLTISGTFDLEAEIGPGTRMKSEVFSEKCLKSKSNLNFPNFNY